MLRQLFGDKIGQREMDERHTIGADPLDPDVGFPPFQPIGLISGQLNLFAETYHPATWITNGVVTAVPYDYRVAVTQLAHSTSLQNPGAMRMSVRGETTSVQEMIATTKRGLLVTRFDRVEMLSDTTLCRGYTRDGVWLIENGKITKAVKNLIFTESILFALDNVEQLGVPQRTFHPSNGDWWDNPEPVFVPPMKIRDFSFTALTNAI